MGPSWRHGVTRRPWCLPRPVAKQEVLSHQVGHFELVSLLNLLEMRPMVVADSRILHDASIRSAKLHKGLAKGINLRGFMLHVLVVKINCHMSAMHAYSYVY